MPEITKPLLLRLFDIEGQLSAAISRGAGKHETELRRHLLEIRRHIRLEMARRNPYGAALELQQERAARRGDLVVLAGEREPEEPRFVGFRDEPATPVIVRGK